jgi:hypothetical protein
MPPTYSIVFQGDEKQPGTLAQETAGPHPEGRDSLQGQKSINKGIFFNHNIHDVPISLTCTVYVNARKIL